MKTLVVLILSLIVTSCATPAPDGDAVTIGVRSALISDTQRTDSLEASRPRQWLIDVYYRAQPTRLAASDIYARDPVLLAGLVANGYYMTESAALQSWALMPAPAALNARQANGVDPVILLSPGSGVAAFNYSQLAADIARRGYTVIVVDHPYVGVSRLPDGRLLSASDDPVQHSEVPSALTPRILEWSSDLSVTLDRLADPRFRAETLRGLNLDLGHVLAVGHSTGGAIALDACAVEARIDACMNFEGGLFGSRAQTAGVSKPVLATGSRARGRPRMEGAGDAMRAALGQGGNRSVWFVRITGGSHLSFSDAPRMMPHTLTHFGGEIFPPERSDAVYAGMVDAFARAYMLGGGGDAAFSAFLGTLPETTAFGPATAP